VVDGLSGLDDHGSMPRCAAHVVHAAHRGVVGLI